MIFHESHTHTDMESCRYLYTEQPPQDLPCNPYPNSGLILRCAISFSTSEEPVDIHWRYYSSSPTATTEITQTNSKYLLYSSLQTGRVTSRLQINGLTDEDVGSYTCHGVFANESRTEESQSLSLYSRVVFVSQQFSACILTSDGIYVNIQRCTYITNPTTITTTDVEDTTTTEIPVTTTEEPITTTEGIKVTLSDMVPTNEGGGGNAIRALGPHAGIIIACSTVVIFIAIIMCILAACFGIFQVCVN